MTRDALIRENEALHGLLAHACTTLVRVAELGSKYDPDTFEEIERSARDALANVQEGYVP